MQKEVEDTRLNLEYRKTLFEIRQQFNSQFNKYQKQQLQQKINCYEKHGKNELHGYYDCIEKLEIAEHKYQNRLKNDLLVIDNADKKCQQFCKMEYAGIEEQLIPCQYKCMEQMKQKTIDIYTNFYQKAIKEQ